MKSCTNCTLPENFPNAQIDDSGQCGYCRRGTMLPDYSHEEPRFEKLIEEQRKDPRQYDCLVCYSGGKDSTYALIRIKERYGMRPLAFTLDNGFISKKAKENIELICGKLGIDLVVVRPNSPQMQALYRATLENKIFDEGTMSRLSATCYACITFVNYQALQLALEKNIRMVVGGLTHGQVPKAVFPLKTEFLRQTFDDAKRKLAETAKFHAEGFYPKVDFDRLDKSEPIYKVNPLLFERYDEKKILAEIGKYGWEKPKDVDSCSTNCLMNRVGNYYHYKRYGYHPYQYEVSSLIRLGSITKEEGKVMLSDKLMDRGSNEIVKEIGAEPAP